MNSNYIRTLNYFFQIIIFLLFAAFSVNTTHASQYKLVYYKSHSLIINYLRSQGVDIARLASGLGAALGGGDASIAASAGGNAAENNAVPIAAIIYYAAVAGISTWTAYDLYNTYQKEGGEAALKQLAIDGAISVVALGAGKVAYKVGGKLIESAPEAFAAVKNLGLWGGKGAGSATLLIDDLVKNGTKITPKDVVDIRKLSDGKIVWLEKGSADSGLEHILVGKTSNFIDKGVPADEIPKLIMDTLQKGTPIGSYGKGGTVFSVTYGGRQFSMNIVVGNNGYVVTAYPLGSPFKPFP